MEGQKHLLEAQKHLLEAQSHPIPFQKQSQMVPVCPAQSLPLLVVTLGSWLSWQDIPKPPRFPQQQLPLLSSTLLNQLLFKPLAQEGGVQVPEGLCWV